MKLSRSTSHLIMSPALSALVLCAMRLDLTETNGRQMGAVKRTVRASESIWTTSGELTLSGDAWYRDGKSVAAG